ncbi:TIR domain-containing protein [Sedimentibacter hydroxybenzoicus DSM 7310]|uniref:TIR domain-containing protein n=1 Tax=Sedimentibacter hydroxybenzoicus DSM 7310 TaxID=1123245 RepID=A0A974BKT1_SEDHY|nr:TIR domain-containing protein [Sedimentibacter hydroxybenzoicus]NYB74833.1 TIR domain-containing protein [Sedimentibacter hydroxybenzoicus DSM 7310]
MSMYNIFISHAWKYDDDYYKIEEWLRNSNISYKNYSVPQHDSFASNTNLKKALTEQIKHANVVLIIAGMYANYSDWIDYEIDEAVRMEKYIIGIYPWGQERAPIKITTFADKMVGWNSASVINAIKET